MDRRAQLTHALIAKSIFEALFVATLAVIFHYMAFNPYFRGWSEFHGRDIGGWAIDEAAPLKRVEVQLFIDGHFTGQAVADLSRPDVVKAHRAPDEWNGFSFQIPSLASGEHEARVYAMHESGGGKRRTLQQIGRPLRFGITASGAINAPASSPPAEDSDKYDVR